MDAVYRLTRSSATKLAWLLHGWRLRGDVREVVCALQDSQTNGSHAIEAKDGESRALKVEVDQLNARIQKIEKELDIAKEGNRALLRFLHTRHRLGVPPEEGSIRSILMKAEQPQ